VNGGLIPVQIRATLLLQPKSWQRKCMRESPLPCMHGANESNVHVHPKQQPKQRHFMSIRPKQQQLLTASCNGGQLLPANACGGMSSASLSAVLPHFPPATMAGPRCFRYRQWRVQHSASPGGGFFFPPMPVAEIPTCRL
jgi:hypothetical protein